MNSQPDLAATGIGVVGGGRWAKVIASILSGVVPQGRLPVCVHSPSAPDAWAEIARDYGWSPGPSLDAMLADPLISHVIIARRARDHAATALACLRAGKAVLIEKPSCLTVGDWDELHAAAAGRVCVTGHVFAYAANIRRFRAMCQSRGAVRRVTLFWGDPLGEVRHGAAKTFDRSLNVFQDLFPHAWSILHPFAGAAPMQLARARASHGGACVVAQMTAGDTEFAVAFSRCHPERLRRLVVEGEGWKGDLDFSREPGTATLGGHPLDVAAGHSSPLRAQLVAFLSDRPLPETAIGATREVITLTLDGLSRIRTQQARLIARRLDVPGAGFALREIALGGIAGDGAGASADEIAGWAGLPAARVRAALAALQSP